MRSRATPVDAVATYFRALADPTRLRILELLCEQGELSVGDLTERLGVAQPAVSSHLAPLRACRLVEARREHRTVYNRIEDERVVEILRLAYALLERNEEHCALCGDSRPPGATPPLTLLPGARFRTARAPDRRARSLAR